MTDSIPALMDLNSAETLKLLLDFQGEIPSDVVVSALTDRRKQLFLYLDALYTKDRKGCPGRVANYYKIKRYIYKIIL